MLCSSHREQNVKPAEEGQKSKGGLEGGEGERKKEGGIKETRIPLFATLRHRGSKMQIDSPQSKDGRSNDGHDPGHRRVRRPPKHEDANGHQDGPHDGRRQPKLGLAAPRDASLLLQLGHEPGADAEPHRVRQHAEHHAHADAHESQANLPQVEAVVRREDERERAEEEVEDAQQNGGEDAQAEAHGLEDEQLKGPLQGGAHGLDHSLLRLFRGGQPPLVAGVLSQLASLISENYRVYNLTRQTLMSVIDSMVSSHVGVLVNKNKGEDSILRYVSGTRTTMATHMTPAQMSRT